MKGYVSSILITEFEMNNKGYWAFPVRHYSISSAERAWWKMGEGWFQSSFTPVETINVKPVMSCWGKGRG